MQLTLKIVLIVILVIYIFCILRSVKKKNMTINYLIFWLITGCILIVALLLPNFVDKISTMLGFGLPINMIFSCAIFVILYLIFNLTKSITKEQTKNTLLIQEISMLKKRIEKLEQNNVDNYKGENK